MKKKILALSTLACLATAGAVFAAFTMDPTTTGDIDNSDIDVDFSSNVFSTFELLTPETGKTYPTFSYSQDPEDPEKDIKDIPVVPSHYTFSAESSTEGAGTLALKCDDKYSYQSSTGGYNWTDYLAWRTSQTEIDPVEDAKRAPHGHAFRYVYDQKFLDKVDEKPGKPADMADYAWHIFNTLFSSGLTKSDFKGTAEDPDTALDDFGIQYTDPDFNNPNYKEFTWVKDINSVDNWVHGSDGFLIIPDLQKDPVSGKAVGKDEGIIVFTGQEMTDDIFSGYFTDDAARDACEAYLKETGGDPAAPIHQKFSVRVKATEYTASEEHVLTHNEPPLFYMLNGENGELLRGQKYKFSIVLGQDTVSYFESGYSLGRFSILKKDKTIVPLVAEGGDVEALKLKVTVKSSDGSEQDITSQFAYGNNSSDTEKYGTIYYNKPTTGAYTPKDGDTLSIEFFLRSSEEKISDWYMAELELTNASPTAAYTLTDDATNHRYTYDIGSDMVVDKGEVYRFVVPVSRTQYLNTFRVQDSTEKAQGFKEENAKIYLLDPNKHMTMLYNDDMNNPTASYSSEGPININGQLLLTRYQIKTTGYSIVIDVTNLKGTDTFKLRNAIAEYADAPMTYDFGTYTPDTTDEFSSGSFVTDITLPESERTLKKGKEFNFEADLNNEKLMKLLGTVVKEDPVVHLISFKFVLTDTNKNEISFVEDPETQSYNPAVFRIDPSGALTPAKDEVFVWKNSNPGTVMLGDGQETTYLKNTLYNGIGKGLSLMRFTVNYNGVENQVFEKATLYVTVSAK